MGDVNTDAQSPLKKRPKIEADANEGGEKFAVPDSEISNWSMMERLFSYSQPQPSIHHDDNEVNEAADSEAPLISNRENMGSNVNPSVLFSFSQPVGPVEEFFLSNTNGTGTLCSQTPMSQRRAGKSPMMLTRLVCRMTRFCVKTSKSETVKELTSNLDASGYTWKLCSEWRSHKVTVVSYFKLTLFYCCVLIS